MLMFISNVHSVWLDGLLKNGFYIIVQCDHCSCPIALLITGVKHRIVERSIRKVNIKSRFQLLRYLWHADPFLKIFNIHHRYTGALFWFNWPQQETVLKFLKFPLSSWTKESLIPGPVYIFACPTKIKVTT